MTRDRTGGFFSNVINLIISLLAPACGGLGQYGDRCGGAEACESRLCVLVDGNRGVCSMPCDAAPCPPGSECKEGGNGAKVCVPGALPLTDGGVPPASDMAIAVCTSNTDCLASQFCDRDQAGRGACASCEMDGCGAACQVGGAGRCLDGERLLFCYQGKTRVVDCAFKNQVCGSRSVGAPQCEAPAPACSLSQCTANGFAYSCASNMRTINYNYGGPGPNGLRSLVVRYSNGHTVTCTFTSTTRGSCTDETGARCSF